MNKATAYAAIAATLLQSCTSTDTATITWNNPVWDGYLADPAILHHDGI